MGDNLIDSLCLTPNMEGLNKMGHADLESTIRWHRIGLKIVGLWPEKEKKKRSRIFSNLRLYTVFTCVTLFLLTPQLCSLVRVWGDLLLVLDNLQVSLPVFWSALKCCILWWKKEAVLPAIIVVRNDWLKLKSREERATMMRDAQLSQRITIVGYSLTASVVILLNTLPCFDLSPRYVTNFTDPGIRPLPSQSYVYYDIRKRRNFIFTYALQSVSFVFAGICFTAVDCLLALFVLHACGQLRNLRQRLTCLTDDENVPRKLSLCVQEHVRLIRLVSIVDNAASLMLLVQLLVFMVLFCCQSFLLIKVFRESNNLSFLRLIWLMGATITIFAHMFLYCFIGEILAVRLGNKKLDGMLKCEEIHAAAYNCKWYTLEPKDSRLLILILIRSSTPLYITAGKIFPMTMAMFCNVVKTSVSYVSVLFTYA